MRDLPDILAIMCVRNIFISSWLDSLKRRVQNSYQPMNNRNSGQIAKKNLIRTGNGLSTSLNFVLVTHNPQVKPMPSIAPATLHAVYVKSKRWTRITIWWNTFLWSWLLSMQVMALHKVLFIQIAKLNNI